MAIQYQSRICIIYIYIYIYIYIHIVLYAIAMKSHWCLTHISQTYGTLARPRTGASHWRWTPHTWPSSLSLPAAPAALKAARALGERPAASSSSGVDAAWAPRDERYFRSEDWDPDQD